MLCIGSIAKTYHILPSQVKAIGTTYDIMISDVMNTWENHKNNPQDQTLYKEDDLVNIVKGVK